MIRRTFHDGNPEDRAFLADFWSWLKDQPQDAWLLYARRANWDNAEWIFHQMADDPACDRAIVSWIFWGCEPGFYVANPDRYRPGALIAKIVANLERGYYPKADLFYDRYEVAHRAHAYLAALEAPGAASPFALPRALCGPFCGRKARLPERYDDGTERDLAEIFAAIDGDLPRSEKQHWSEQEKGGNLWLKDVFALPRPPANPATALRALDDARYVEAIFGRRASYVAARKKAQANLARGGARLGKGDALTLKLLAAFGVLAIGGAAIAHRINTGSW